MDRARDGCHTRPMAVQWRPGAVHPLREFFPHTHIRTHNERSLHLHLWAGHAEVLCAHGVPSAAAGAHQGAWLGLQAGGGTPAPIRRSIGQCILLLHAPAQRLAARPPRPAPQMATSAARRGSGPGALRAFATALRGPAPAAARAGALLPAFAARRGPLAQLALRQQRLTLCAAAATDAPEETYTYQAEVGRAGCAGICFSMKPRAACLAAQGRRGSFRRQRGQAGGQVGRLGAAGLPGQASAVSGG